ncbi:DUF4974 domain-containing protein [Alistipes sp. OttesenSCG-928-B03]|nr:DUF4974 domain-containing protein [Alistipes sp. OttesenSCG-928-B03]
MEKEKHIEKISTLLGKYAAGEATDEERAVLEEWAAGSERAVELMRSVADMNVGEDGLRRFFVRTDTEAAWREMRSRMFPRRRRRGYRLAARYAAAVLLLAAVAGGVFLLTESPAEIAVINTPESKAVLTVSDGNVIDLGAGTEPEGGLLDLYGASGGGDRLTYNDSDSIGVVMQRLSIFRGGEFCIDLSDGTRVWLNSETVLTYPNRFSGDERRVEVEGEAYFEVMPGERPFIVHTAGLDVRVTGTEFNVMAYADDATAEVTLVKGSVRAETPDDGVDLTPGLQAVLSLADRSLSVRKVDTSLHTSWRDGVFEFRTATLREIAVQLERWYDVDIVFRDASIGDIRFTGAIKKSNSLNYMLDILKATKSIEYSVEGRTVTLSNK